MIEFNGYISGAAEKKFFEKSRNFAQSIFIVTMLLFLPIILLIVIKTQYWLLLGGYIVLFVVVVLVMRSPLSNKESMQFKPKRIFTSEGYIVCVTDKTIEYKLISDVKQVRNFEDFYEIVFPFGKISDKYICQKSLLVKGSLDEFEALFGDKIVNYCHTKL